jgi:nitroimidazol reductase NimA-like FMN-containing flavoprotein (pyridoxamine 5'-phosphate oxidase superfamily)
MREMRRKDKEIGTDEAINLLTKCEYGVLSTVGTDGQPYGVPLNYTYKDNCIYFHCALKGHKIDNLDDNPKVSFCTVGNTEVLPSEFSTNYVSTVVFGVASEVLGTERYDALVLLLEKFSPGFMEEGKKYIEKLDKVTKVIKIDIQHISGKKSTAKKTT